MGRLGSQEFTKLRILWAMMLSLFYLVRALQWPIRGFGVSWLIRTWRVLAGLRQQLDKKNHPIISHIEASQTDTAALASYNEYGLQVEVPFVLRPPPVRMDLGWEPAKAWKTVKQEAIDSEFLFRSPSPPEKESLELYGIRVENRLTRQVWHFEDVESLYFASCVDGQFAIAGKQWTPGVYNIHNATADDLYVITGGRTHSLKAGERVMLKAHNHV